MEDDSSAISNTSKYFNYSIREVQIFNSKTYQETPIQIELCTKKHFRNIVNRTFDLRGLSKMYCPILDNVNFTVEGTMMDPYYKYYNLEIWLTEYALNNFNELTNYVDKYPLEMSYYFLDTAIDYENRNEPLPHFLNYIFKGLDIKYQKNTEIILSPMEFSNDENIFINNAHMIYGATVDAQSDSFHSITETNYLGQSLIGKYIVKTSPIMFTLSRTYQKLPSFIADLSGILEQILALVLLCINIIERQAIDNKLIRKMIKFKGNKNCNVNYLIKVFNRENNNNMNGVMEMINRKKMFIKKNTGIKNEKRSLDIFINRNYKSISNRNNFMSENDLNKLSNHKKYLSDNTHDDNKEVSLKEKDEIDKLNLNINNSKNLSLSKNDKRLNSSRNFINNGNFSSPNIGTLDFDKRKLGTIVNLNLKNIKKKQKEDNYYQLGIFDAIWSKLFFWFSKKQERRKEFFTKAEEKIHYFFDVNNYIQKMQEIDLLIYSLLDHDQVKLLDFLSRPPFKIGQDKLDIYNEFESRQSLEIKIGKKQIDDLYNAYNNIRTKDELNFEDLKLMRLVNAEIKFLS